MTEWVRIAVTGLQLLVSPVDGDTVRMADGSLVRLKGIDTPELRSKCPTPASKAREAFKARLARDRIADILRERHVTLTILPEQCGHGRACGRLTVEGRDAVDILVNEGLGVRMDCEGGKCPPPADWCREGG